MTNHYILFCFTLLIVGIQKTYANPFSTPNATYEKMLNFIVDMTDQESAKSASVNKTFLNINSNKDEVFKEIEKITHTHQPNFHKRFQELSQHINQIELTYDKFVNIFTNYDNYESNEILNFVQTTTTHSLVELQASVEKMHEVLIDRDASGESIISIIAEETTVSDALQLNQSVQQIIYALYDVVISTHIKAFVTTAYSYNLKETFENVSYEPGKNRLRVHYFSMIWNTFQKVKKAMLSANRKLIKSDPVTHIKDITYSRLYPVFQGYFVYERDTSASKWYTFFHECESLTDVKLRCDSEPCQKTPKEKRCTGIIRNCQYIDSSIDMCHSSTDDRVYDWAVTKSNVTYGHKNRECQNLLNEHSVLTYDVCLCTCESNNIKTDRYFSLQDVLSDSENNKVITGVRLVKRKYIFYIQIQQGTLGANGSIIGEPQWQAIKELSPINLYMNKKVFKINNNQKTVFLDTLRSGKAHALTGLRFKKIEGYLRLEARKTSFNYETGKLRWRQTSWISNPNDIKSREKLLLISPDDPTIMESSRAVTFNNRYIHFRMTDFHRDLGQTVVPFIDTQDVITNPPMPISGVGLYHKGRKYSGGFLGLKLIHYNFIPHM